MRWEPARLAAFARDAGFGGDAVATAVALAVATSGGIDHYHLSAGIPAAGDWRGLWGINVAEFPEYADADLYDPVVNARAAHQLSEAHRGFWWADAYLAGSWVPWLDIARTEATRVWLHPPAPFSINVAGARRTVRAALDTLPSIPVR